jgi:hypothetical protein
MISKVWGRFKLSFFRNPLAGLLKVEESPVVIPIPFEVKK